MTSHIEILTEEQSMESALRLLVPKVISGISFEIYPSQNKSELISSLPARLRAYPKWIPETCLILVILDRDNDDCVDLKSSLDDFARAAGLGVGLGASGGTARVVNRIAIEELEAWFFGDWPAVMHAYPGVDKNLPAKSGFRDPDLIPNAWESLERVLQRAGYFRTGLRKIELAQTITPHMSVANNRSRSFQAFVKTLQDYTNLAKARESEKRAGKMGPN